MTQLWGGAALGKIFISHSSVDKPFVRRRLDNPLRSAGYDTWLDEKEVIAGDPLPSKVSEGIRNAKVFIVVISSASVKSSWLKYELNMAANLMINKELRLIPIIIDDVVLPAEIDGQMYVDMRKGVRGGKDKIFKALDFEASKYPQPPGSEASLSAGSFLNYLYYEKQLGEAANGGSFTASMDLSATLSVDWSGITINDNDVRVDMVQSYGREVVFGSKDLDGWVGQLAEISQDFAILVLEGRLSGDLGDKFDQPLPGIWVQAIPVGLVNSSGARIIVEIDPEGSESKAKKRLVDAVHLISDCIASWEPSHLDTLASRKVAGS